jgi:hypothetical protein
VGDDELELEPKSPEEKKAEREAKQKELDAKLAQGFGLPDPPPHKPTPKGGAAEALMWSGLAAYSKAEAVLNNQLGKFPRPDDSLETILIIPDGEDVNVPGGGYLEVASSTPGGDGDAEEGEDPAVVYDTVEAPEGAIEQRYLDIIPVLTEFAELAEPGPWPEELDTLVGLFGDFPKFQSFFAQNIKLIEALIRKMDGVAESKGILKQLRAIRVKTLDLAKPGCMSCFGSKDSAPPPLGYKWAKIPDAFEEDAESGNVQAWDSTEDSQLEQTVAELRKSKIGLQEGWARTADRFQTPVARSSNGVMVRWQTLHPDDLNPFESRDPSFTIVIPKQDALPTDYHDKLEGAINTSAKNANDVMRLLAPDSRPTGELGEPETDKDGTDVTQGDDAILTVVNPADYEPFTMGLRKYATARDIAREIGGEYLVDEEENRILNGGMVVAPGRMLKPAEEKMGAPVKPAWLQEKIDNGTATEEQIEKYTAELELFFEDPEAYFRKKAWEKAAEARTLCFDAIINSTSNISLRMAKTIKKSVLRGVKLSSALQFLIVAALVGIFLLAQALFAWESYDAEADRNGNGPGWILPMEDIVGPGSPLDFGGGSDDPLPPSLVVDTDGVSCCCHHNPGAWEYFCTTPAYCASNGDECHDIATNCPVATLGTSGLGPGSGSGLGSGPECTGNDVGPGPFPSSNSPPGGFIFPGSGSGSGPPDTNGYMNEGNIFCPLGIQAFLEANPGGSGSGAGAGSGTGSGTEERLFCDAATDCGESLCSCALGMSLCESLGSPSSKPNYDSYDNLPAKIIISSVIVVFMVVVFALTYDRSGNYKDGVDVRDVRLFRGLSFFNRVFHELFGLLFILVALAALVIGLIIFAQRSGPALAGFLAAFFIAAVNIFIGAIAAFSPTLLEKVMMKLAKYGGKKLLVFLKSNSITVARVVTAVIVAFAYCITGRFCARKKKHSDEISLIPMREMKLAMYQDIEAAREAGKNPVKQLDRIPSQYYDAYRNERGTLDPFKYLAPSDRSKKKLGLAVVPGPGAVGPGGQSDDGQSGSSLCDLLFTCLSCAWCPNPEFNPVLAILEWVELIFADVLRLLIVPLSLMPCCKGIDVKSFEDCAECFLDGWDCQVLHADCIAAPTLDFGAVLPSPKIDNIGTGCVVTLTARDGSPIGKDINGTVLWQGYDNHLPVPLVAVKVDEKWYNDNCYEEMDPKAVDGDGMPVIHKMVHEALDPVKVQGKYICCPCLWQISTGGFDGKYLGREIQNDTSLVQGVSTKGLSGDELAAAEAQVAESVVWGSLEDVDDTRTLIVPASMVQIGPKVIVAQPKMASVPHPNLSADGTNRIQVSWTGPGVSNGSVQKYRLRYGVKDSGNLTTVDIEAAADTRYTIKHLEPDTNYIVHLDTFIGTAGDPATGSASASTLTLPPALVSVPAPVLTTDGTTKVGVSWPAANISNGVLDHYQLRFGVKGSGSLTTVTIEAGAAENFTIGNLTPATTYVVHLDTFIKSESFGFEPGTSSAVPEAGDEDIYGTPAFGAATPPPQRSDIAISDLTGVADEAGEAFGFNVTATEAFAGFSVTEPEGTASATVATLAAPAPVLTAEGPTQIKVRWSGAVIQNGVLKYRIRYGIEALALLEGAGSLSTVDYTNPVESPGTDEHFLISDLDASTTYVVYVDTFINDIMGDPDASASATVDTLPPPPTLVSVPIPVLTADGPTQIGVSWTAATVSDGSHPIYQLRYGKEGTAFLTTVDVDAGTGERFVIRDLEPLTSYIVHIDTFIGTMPDPTTASASTVTLAPPPSLLFVPAPVLAADAPTQINVSWTAANVTHGSVEKYQLRYGIVGSDDLTTIDIEAGAGEGFVLTDLEPRSNYIVHLDTFIGAEAGPATASASTTTPAQPPRLASVPVPVLSGKLPTKINVSWTAATVYYGSVEKVQLRYGIEGSEDDLTAIDMEIGAGESYVLTDLEPMTSYIVHLDTYIGNPYTDPAPEPATASAMRATAKLGKSWKQAATTDGRIVSGSYAAVNLRADGSAEEHFETDGSSVAAHFIRTDSLRKTAEPERAAEYGFPSQTAGIDEELELFGRTSIFGMTDRELAAEAEREERAIKEQQARQTITDAKQQYSTVADRVTAATASLKDARPLEKDGCVQAEKQAKADLLVAERKVKKLGGMKLLAQAIAEHRGTAPRSW